MSWMNIADVINGFGGRSREIRDQETARADEAFKLERRTLEWLATSDDPEIRARALTGILQSSQPQRKKGLGGWFGEVETHPAYASIRDLMNTPLTSTEQIRNPEGGKPIYGAGTNGSLGRMVGNPGAGDPALQGAGDPALQGAGGMSNLVGDDIAGPGMGEVAGMPTSWWREQFPNLPGMGGGGRGMPPDMSTTDGPAPMPAAQPPPPPAPQSGLTRRVQVPEEDQPPVPNAPMQQSPGPVPPPLPQAQQPQAQPSRGIQRPTNAPIGRVPTSYSSVTTTKPRQVFDTPEQTIRKNAIAQFGGRMEGIVEGSRQYGVDYTPEQVQRIAEGLSGVPQRRTRYIPKMVEFRDGTTGPVSYNDATGEWEDGYGNKVDPNDIVKELPRPSGAANKPVLKRIWDDERRDWRWSQKLLLPDGTWDDVDAGPAEPPPDVIHSGPTNVTRIPSRGGGPAEVIPGVTPRPPAGANADRIPAVAKERVRQLEKDVEAVDAAGARAGKVGGVFVERRANVAREAEAMRRDHKNVQDLHDKLRAARATTTTSKKDAGGEGEPPPDVTTPPVRGGAPAANSSEFGGAGGAAAIRKFLPPRAPG